MLSIHGRAEGLAVCDERPSAVSYGALTVRYRAPIQRWPPLRSVPAAR